MTPSAADHSPAHQAPGQQPPAHQAPGQQPPAQQPPGQHRPLKPLDFSVLLVLAEREDYGYRIVKRIASPDAGRVRLAPSNLYNVLDRMIDAGLVEDLGKRAEGARPPRRYYGITEFGRAVVSAEAQRLQAVVRSAARLDLLPEGRGR